MNGSNLLTLIETDRGRLSLSGQGNDCRLQRYVDSRFADRTFRRKVQNLASAVKQWKPARVLPIHGHDQIGDHYLIEYELPPAAAAESLPNCFADRDTHWLVRLSVIRQLIGVCANIRTHISAPLGLHAGTVVACRIGAGWEAFLALCPNLELAAADEYMHAHPWALSGVAPERLRGSPGMSIQEDIYAAGVLVSLALGLMPATGLSGEDAIEAQACASFLNLDIEYSDVEPALRKIPYVAVRLEELESIVRRCIHFTPNARGTDLAALEKACDRVLMLLNTEAFATEIESQGNSGDALRFLEWAIARGYDSAGVRQMAVRLCEKTGQADRELWHLEKLIAWRPLDEATRRRRWNLRYDAYFSSPRREGRKRDAEGEWLLRELNELRPAGIEELDREEREKAKEDFLKAATIYDLWGDLYGKAREMYQLTRIDYKDIEALLLYGLSCREIAEDETLPMENRNQAKQIQKKLFPAVADRISRLEVAGILDKEAAKTWVERFKSLLLS